MAEIDADLVVIGAGGSGLAAALTALDLGVKGVVLLEKRPVVGGNSAMSGGYMFAAGTPQQREAGVEVSKDELFDETMKYHQYKADPNLVRMFIDESAETVKWMEEKGVAYGYVAWGPNPAHVPSGWQNPPGSFSKATKILGDAVTVLDGTILRNTSATAILRESGDGVTAVIAQQKSGEEIRINTPAVILTTGGFTGNPDLLTKHFPDSYEQSVYWTDSKPLTGDGVALASAAGAATDGRSALIQENGYSFRTKRHMPNRAAMEFSSIWVNKYGQRFLDESKCFVNLTTNALTAQPGKTGYALFDDALVQAIIDKPDPFAGKVADEDDDTAWTPDSFRRSFREVLVSEAEIGEWTAVASDWDEIAAWIGADPDELRKTVDAYNAGADAGVDSQLSKPSEFLTALRTPPFYALKFRPLMVETAGPIRVTEKMEVLDTSHQPIPGLYAAGVATAGWIGENEHLFGTPLSYALSSGRVAGRSVSEYVAAVSETSQ